MANPVWPPSLPDYLLQRGYHQQRDSATIETNMDAGPPKRRRRFTAAPESIAGTISISAAQKATLAAFHNSTLAEGALPFDWVDPVEGTAATFVIVEPPKFSAAGGGRFYAELSLRIDP